MKMAHGSQDIFSTIMVRFVASKSDFGALPTRAQDGFMTMSQKIAITLANAGQPSQNHQRMAR